MRHPCLSSLVFAPQYLAEARLLYHIFRSFSIDLPHREKTNHTIFFKENMANIRLTDTHKGYTLSECRQRIAARRICMAVLFFSAAAYRSNP